MADTNVTNGDVQWETDDNLDESNLARALAQANATDYVERGFGFSVDFGVPEVTIGTSSTRGNYAVIQEDKQAWLVFTDSTTTVSLDDGTTNHLFLAYDKSNDQPYFHQDTADSAPSDPSVKIGTVDTSADTSTELNREPDVNARTLAGGGSAVDVGDDLIPDAASTHKLGSSAFPWTSVTTEDMIVTSLSAGSTKKVYEADLTSTKESHAHVQYTDGVSTSATTIFTTGPNGAFVLVMGTKDGDGSTVFTDLVHFLSFQGTNVVSSVTGGSPDGRTYSVNSEQLQLAMAANTYNVGVHALSTFGPA